MDHADTSAPASVEIVTPLAEQVISITRTFIGEEYGWDRLEDVNWELLRQNRDCAERILQSPSQFPKADFDYVSRKVDEIDEFERKYAPLIPPDP